MISLNSRVDILCERPSMLYRDAAAAFGAAAGERLAAASSLHAHAKPVAAGSLAFLWLVRE